MDLDVKDTLDFLHSAARSVGAEVTSPWFYLQLALMLAGGGLALAAGAAIRSQVKLSALGLAWPAPLRLFMRMLVDSAPTAVFAALMGLARLVMVNMTWPSRSYLLLVAASLALAWLVIRLVASGIRNSLVVRVVSVTAWLVAALIILAGSSRWSRRWIRFRSRLA